MSSNSTHEFPAPVGGVPYPLDFAPSILFAVLYGLMVPVVVFRMIHPRSRNGVLIGTMFFSIERCVSVSLALPCICEASSLIALLSVVAYSLRAHAAHSASARASEGLETYFQTTYSGGFISIGQDLFQLLRALLVSSTLGGEMVALHPLTPPHVWNEQMRRRHQRRPDNEEVPLTARPTEDDDAASYPGVHKANAGSSQLSLEGAGCGLEDQPELRKSIRTWFAVPGLTALAVAIMSIVAGANYRGALDNGTHASLVRSLWYVPWPLYSNEDDRR